MARKSNVQKKTTLRDYLQAPSEKNISMNTEGKKSAKKAGKKSNRERGSKAEEAGGIPGKNVGEAKGRKKSRKSGKITEILVTEEKDWKSKKTEEVTVVDIVEKENVNDMTKNDCMKKGSNSRKQEGWKSKKRDRDVVEIDKTSGKNVGPAKKKAKLVPDEEGLFKQPKGGKKKRNTFESDVAVEVTSTKKTGTVDENAKSPKISSDEDFVKTSRRSRRSSRRVEKNGGEETGGENEKDVGGGIRRSGRLRKRIEAEEVEKEICGENIVENEVKGTDIEREGCVDESSIEMKGNGMEENSQMKQGDKSEVKRRMKRGTKNETDSNIKVKDEPEVKTKAEIKSEPDVKDKAEVNDELEVKNKSQLANEAEGKHDPVLCTSDDGVKSPSNALRSSETLTSEPEVKNGQRTSVLWTECFKPGRSDEILGNISAGNKLKNWLSEWKSLREKKLDKIRRHREKKRVRLTADDNIEKLSGTEWWYEDESDFDVSDDSGDSYYDEEDMLCNTMILTGKTGCGKTSAVYACAKELGFKVIEVNSSTKRGGKYILTEFQEATQSHQVSRKRHSLEKEPGVETISGNKNVSEKEEKKKRGRKPKKGKNEKEIPKSAPMVQAKMSLILLDEVDVLFEEDKGFWAAVHQLRLNSKRPIVMTASDPVLGLDGRYEHISLKQPPPQLNAAYLQTVCLSKNIFLTPDDLQSLAVAHNGDMRRSLLCLQFWSESNGGGCDPCGTVVNKRISKVFEMLARKNEPVLDEEDETKTDCKEILKTSSAKCGKTRIISEIFDENSATLVGNTRQGFAEMLNSEKRTDKLNNISAENQAEMDTPCTIRSVSEPLMNSDSQDITSSVNEPSDTSRNATIVLKGIEESNSNEVTDESLKDCTSTIIIDKSLSLKELSPVNKDCVMHQLCVESFLGLRNVTSSFGSVLDVLRCNGESMDNRFGSEILFNFKCAVSSHCQDLGFDVIRCNLARLLPCLFNYIDNITDITVGKKTTNVVATPSTIPDGNTISKGPNKGLSDTSVYDDETNHPEVLVCGITAGNMGDFTELNNEVPTTNKGGDRGLHAGEESRDVEPEVKDEKQPENEGVKRNLLDITLKSYQQLLENISFMDAELRVIRDITKHEVYEKSYTFIRPGLEDTVKNAQDSVQSSWKSRQTLNELRGALEVATLERCHGYFHNRMTNNGQEFKSKAFGLLSETTDLCQRCQSRDTQEEQVLGLRTSDLTTSASKVADKEENECSSKATLHITTSHETSGIKLKDYDAVTNYLPDHLQLNRSSFCLDYIPTLHNICHNERLRQASRVKRRFYHYFDSIGLNLPQSTIQLLSEENFT